MDSRSTVDIVHTAIRDGTDVCEKIDAHHVFSTHVVISNRWHMPQRIDASACGPVIMLTIDHPKSKSIVHSDGVGL